MNAMHRTTSSAAGNFYRGRDLEAKPLLTAAQEVELATAARAGDSAARDRLVQANLRLVITIARDFRGRGLDIEDLVGEGNLGLIRAAAEFDPSFGVRFSTYAAYWIKQAMRHALITTTAPIRLPAHMVVLLTRWRRAERELLRTTGTPPTPEELAGALGLGEAKRRMIEQALRAHRLAPDGGDDGDGDRMVDSIGGGDRPEAGAESEDERRELGHRLDRLDARERMIVELRYGLDGREPQTLKEIGHRLGVTREWVRKVEMRAIKRLGDDLPPKVGLRRSPPPAAARVDACGGETGPAMIERTRPRRRHVDRGRAGRGPVSYD